MLYRFLSRFFFAAGVILLGVSGYMYFKPEDKPGAIIEEPERELALSVGDPIDISFELHNPTGHVVKIVGYQFC